MDVLYEESAVNSKSASAQKKYKILNAISIFFGIIALILGLFFIINIAELLMMISGLEQETKETGISLCVFLGLSTFFFGGFWFYFFWLKRRMNVSYDYTFVSGEIRISKVFNLNRRKFMFRFESEDILKIGDVDNGNFDRLRADPMNKLVICTPNEEPMNGKFFMYIQAVVAGERKLIVLEVREEMLVKILGFAKRGVLENEYVSQEKKNKK